MIFGVILAGGVGKRMGNVDKPKQFLMIGEKPIIVHTAEKFIINDNFEKIIVLCPEKWVTYTRKLFDKYLQDTDRIAVISGGETRNGTIMNAIKYIDENYGIDDDTALVTHDAVRPFVTQRILDDNIRCASEGKACDTVFPATDTIVESLDGKTINSVPKRKNLYQGQTPQSFPAKMFRDLYEGMSDDDRSILTDAAKVFVMNGHSVELVRGEAFNIKVTYPYDLQLAETLLEGGR
jgi:2-C-methyl-D-erythritol 4-phosphate cytidylyltransferase